MKAGTAEHPPSDVETSGKTEASDCEVAAENVPGLAAEKKRTKVVRFRMTPEHIGRAFSICIGTRPMPTFPEQALASVEEDKDLLDSIRNNLAGTTVALYALREQTKEDAAAA